MDIINRRTIKSSERTAIFNAWGNICAYCEENPAEMVDHIVPFSKGGKCELENFAASCSRCNHKKTNYNLGEGYIQIILAIANKKAQKIRNELTKSKKPKNVVTKPTKSKENKNYIIASKYGDWTNEHSKIITIMDNNDDCVFYKKIEDEKYLETFYIFNALLKKGNKTTSLFKGVSYCYSTKTAKLKLCKENFEYLKICASKKPKANEIIFL